VEQWQMLQCCGCDNIKVFLKEDSPDYKDPKEFHYPPKQIRPKPKCYGELPEKCQSLICEIYTAMHDECMTLATIGTRTIVDHMLTEMLGDIGGFKRKLSEAVTNGYFTEKQKGTVSAAIDAGSAAAHRGFTPTRSQLDDVLDIVEHALISQYVLAASAGRLKKEVPQRGSSEV
jgi:hypothetical protein